ncbi:ATP-binding protein [Desnuesiella massiliensis]|uniref:ATP-binding protein n=1 Tax=Desnuesiella massiliensis TaxID=1650662 RepID=UPI0006E2E39E|nr:ATP-binding protein [Desnuesiella massiliensis]
MDKILIPNGCEAEVADYKEQIVADYKNNPLIEALPPIYEVQKVVENLAVYPVYSNEERKLDNHYRIHLIQRLFQVFQPLPFHIDLESKVSRALRQGYIIRNPFRAELAKGFNKEFDLTNNLRFESNNLVKQTASGFTLIGISGSGKTSSLERILSMYPQVISHSSYKGIAFSMYQLVWIKLNCPFDGSVKGICIEFFSEVDRLLGTNYHKKVISSRPSTNVMMSMITQIVRNSSIGCIIIDEIQHLSLGKSGGTEKMLNFFVTLVNQVGVPIIMVGTPNGMAALQSQFRISRRGAGQGDLVIDKIPNDKTWDLLINSIWQYQWTRKETSLTKELSDAFYDESQGIIDILKKLYAMVQIKAITSGREEITINLIKLVANESLKLVQPMLQALKTGDIRKIAKYDDICLSNITIGDYMSKARHSIDLNLKEKAIKSQVQDEKDNNLESKREKAVVKLIELGISAKKAQKAVDNVDNKEAYVDVNTIVIKAISSLNDTAKEKKKENKVNLDTDDIRYIVQLGEDAGISAYDALKEKKYIVMFEDDIFNEG